MTPRPCAGWRPGWRLAWPAAWFRAGLWCLVHVVAVAGGPAARGEDDRVVDDLVENAAETTDRQSDHDLEENFDRNVFDAHAHANGFTLMGGTRRPGKAAAAEPGRAAESPTDAKVRACVEPQFQQITAMIDLAPPQARKLRLAIESDIRRAADDIDVQRHKYRGVALKGQWVQDPQQQRLMQQWQTDVQRCRDRMRQVCGSESFLAKSLPTTLDTEQQARLTATIDDRLDYLWRAVVARQMLRFDAALGLDQRQHEALETLLGDARPTLAHSFGTAPQVHPYADTLIRLAVLEIGDERLRTAVSGRQAQVLREFSRQGAAQRQFLESQGVLQKKVQ